MFPAKMPCQLQAGQVINRKYQIAEEVGSGGFGCVYAAKNLNLGTRVAIKLRREAGPDARIWREAQLAATLRSPYSVRIFDVDRLDDGTPYIVMEFLEGQTLREYLRYFGKAPIERAVHWTLQICAALREAHAAGLVHRDIKPSNLFLVGSGHVETHIKLVDFGLAKNLGDTSVESVTESGVVLGSPAYMAPERVRAGVDTAQTDIWSVGVVLFEMLSGKLPFEGETNSALLAAIAADPPRPLSEVAPEQPSAIGAIIARCLRKRPADRYASVDALAHELKQFEGESPSPVLNDERVTASATLEEHASRSVVRKRGSSPGRWLFFGALLGVPLLVWLASLVLGASTPAKEPAALIQSASDTVSARTVASSPAPRPASLTSSSGVGATESPASVQPAALTSGEPRVTRRARSSAEPPASAARAPAGAGSVSAPNSATPPRLFAEPDF